MSLGSLLGITAAAEIDVTRPIKFGPFDLSADAAAEAFRILENPDFFLEVNFRSREFAAPVYWLIEHRISGQAEIFGFPKGTVSQLPTAIEIALVRAIAGAAPEHHSSILGGGLEISIGPSSAYSKFRDVLGGCHPAIGQSLLFAGPTQVVVHDTVDKLLNPVAQRCFTNSFSASPLKFRFLEIYRVMEARFLADVRSKLFSKFDEEPGVALAEAQESIKSEMNQIIGLAETQIDAFQACWTSLNEIRNHNRFVAALFRRVEKRKLAAGRQWQIGAALIYQMRCAIVHSGEKDLIFESFSDGDSAIEKVLPDVERAALLLVGIDLS